MRSQKWTRENGCVGQLEVKVPAEIPPLPAIDARIWSRPGRGFAISQHWLRIAFGDAQRSCGASGCFQTASSLAAHAMNAGVNTS